MKKRDLEYLFNLRKEFLRELKEHIPGAVHEIPLNLNEKQSQVFIRETALRGVEEMFEALQLLKNSKPHRKTEITEFNQEHFLEEIVDAFNYFFSMLIYLDIDSDEFIEAFERKHSIIVDRLKSGY